MSEVTSIAVTPEQLDAIRQAVEWLDAYIGDARRDGTESEESNDIARDIVDAAVLALEELGVAVERTDYGDEDEDDEEDEEDDEEDEEDDEDEE